MSLITYVTKIHFAEGVLEDALEGELELLRLKRPLVICDDGPLRETVTGRLIAAIPRSVEAAIFEASSTHATEETCERAALLYADWEADGVIGFGGAAAINLAKATALRVSHPGSLRQYGDGTGGGARIRDVLPPVMAIPTIAGSCTETVGVAMLAVPGEPSITLISPLLTPRVVICDPTLTLDLPPGPTACAGMDALTHCLETYIAAAYNPPADGIARDGLRRIVKNLERAVADGSDLEARREMMAAALNGGLAHQKGLGGVHAMSHGLTGVGAGISDHGALNAVLLPLVLDFNAPAVGARYDALRAEFGLRRDAGLPEAVIGLRRRVALPDRLSALGVRKADLARAASFAAADYTNRTNPRHAGADDYLALLNAAF